MLRNIKKQLWTDIYEPFYRFDLADGEVYAVVELFEHSMTGKRIVIKIRRKKCWDVHDVHMQELTNKIFDYIPELDPYTAHKVLDIFVNSVTNDLCEYYLPLSAVSMKPINMCQGRKN